MLWRGAGATTGAVIYHGIQINNTNFTNKPFDFVQSSSGKYIRFFDIYLLLLIASGFRKQNFILNKFSEFSESE